MQKMMSILACVLCAAALVAGPYVPVSVTVPAGRTAVTNVYDFAALGIGASGEIDQIVYATAGSNTGAVHVALFDTGVATNILDTAITATNVVVYMRPRWALGATDALTNICFNTRKVRVIINQTSNGSAQKWDGAIFLK